MDTKSALSHLAQIRVVGYSYKPEIALKWGLSEENRHRVGVIAQELAEILPDAVTDNGDFLQVHDFLELEKPRNHLIFLVLIVLKFFELGNLVIGCRITI